MNILDVKKILAGSLAIVMCFGMAACGNDDDDDDDDDDRSSKRTHSRSKDSSEDESEDEDGDIDPFGNKDSDDDSSETIPDRDEPVEVVEEVPNEYADVLPQIQLDNATVKWCAHYDINPIAGEDAAPALRLFRQQYNGDIQHIFAAWDDRYDKLAALIISQDSPDLFPADDMDSMPKGVIKGMFQPVDDYIDFGSELWQDVAALNDGLALKGKHYLCATGAAPNYVCYYNTATIRKNGFDDPAKLYYNNEWTWSKFTEMCTAFTDPDRELFGIDGYWYSNALNDTCGMPLIGIENGKFVNNMSDPNVCRVQDLMYDFQKKGLCFDRANNGWSTRGVGDTGDGLGSYQTLFIPAGLWAIEYEPNNTTLFGDIYSDEIMFVPMPRMDDSDTYYVSGRINGFHIVQGASNPAGAAAYISCVKATKDETEQLTEEVLRDKYCWNDDMIKMREEIFGLLEKHPVIDFQNGLPTEDKSDDFYLMSNVGAATMSTGGYATTWDECRDSYEKLVDYYVKKANDSF